MEVVLFAGPLLFVIVFSIGMLAWRLRQGDQIESTSEGKRFFGRRRRDDLGR